MSTKKVKQSFSISDEISSLATTLDSLTTDGSAASPPPSGNYTKSKPHTVYGKRWDKLTTEDWERLAERLMSTDKLSQVKPLVEMYGKDLLMYQDEISGNTSLHYARHAEIARFFIESNRFRYTDERNSYMLMKNNVDQSALHAACELGRKDVVKVLLKYKIVHDDLLSAADWYGNTPLHNVENELTARCLLSKAQKSNRIQELVFQRNKQKQTALHTACLRDRDDVAELLVKHTKHRMELINANDNDLNTALHLVKSKKTASILVDYLTTLLDQDAVPLANHFANAQFKKLDPSLKRQNSDDQSVLHAVSYMQQDKELVQFILAQLSEQCMLDLQKQPDINGNTPLLLAINAGNEEIVKVLLEICGSEVVTKLLSQKNKNGQTAFHIASFHLRCHAFLEILTEYSEDVKMEIVMRPDKFGNSPLSYLAGLYNVEHFSYHILKSSLPRRRMLVYNRNAADTSIKAIINRREDTQDDMKNFFLRSILNDQQTSNLYGFYSDKIDKWQWLLMRRTFCLTFDKRLQQVLMYTLKEHSCSLSDTYLGLHPFDQLDNIRQRIRDTKKGEFENVWAQAHFNTTQDDIAELDIPQLHGKLKVIVQIEHPGSSDIESLVPPSPDYIIIQICLSQVSTEVERFIQQQIIKHRNDLTLVLNKLRKIPQVKSVTVNSSSGRHLVTNGQDLCLGGKLKENSIVVTGGRSRRGKALIVCYTRALSTERSTWMTQLEDVMFILGKQLGMKTKLRLNLKASELPNEIESLSSEVSQDMQMVAVALMSHGDEKGNIKDADGNIILVQSLLDNIQKSFPEQVKLILLSFCRGHALPIYNRTHNSFESKELPKIVNSAQLHSVIQKKPPATWKPMAPHVRINVPVNCYILFTTLPDSKSPTTNITFEVMRKYLTDVWEACREGSTGLTTTPQGTQDTSSYLLPHVELTTLLTDVAGLTRQKSEFKIYPNHHYTLNHQSKPVYIDILHHNHLDLNEKRLSNPKYRTSYSTAARSDLHTEMLSALNSQGSLRRQWYLVHSPLETM